LAADGVGFSFKSSICYYVGLPGVKQKRKEIIARLMELAETKNDTILYAA
jgi:hypothetical protein